MTNTSSGASGSGAAKGAIGGLIGGALVNQAVKVGNDWNEERKAKKAIIRLFREACLDNNKNIRTDRTNFTVAGLTFRCSGRLVDADNDVYCQVEVINAELAGDDPRRVRTFRYFLGIKGDIERSLFSRLFATEAKKGQYSWPPYLHPFN
ncbi:hypothetical protein ACFZCT_18830 [Streptomyces qaidamensis]|uniref:hypothetical protein n=1 Tax=Streptomyces qaidamensis TaxID=1783515 RepID=UPI0036E18EEC